jgi:hypothetical protein
MQPLDHFGAQGAFHRPVALITERLEQCVASHRHLADIALGELVAAARLHATLVRRDLQAENAAGMSA